MRWTCAEFHRFGDMGVFEGRRAMLIDGVILERLARDNAHSELTREVIRTLQRREQRGGESRKPAD